MIIEFIQSYIWCPNYATLKGYGDNEEKANAKVGIL